MTHREVAAALSRWVTVESPRENFTSLAKYRAQVGPYTFSWWRTEEGVVNLTRTLDDSSILPLKTIGKLNNAIMDALCAQRRLEIGGKGMRVFIDAASPGGPFAIIGVNRWTVVSRNDPDFLSVALAFHSGQDEPDVLLDRLEERGYLLGATADDRALAEFVSANRHDVKPVPW